MRIQGYLQSINKTRFKLFWVQNLFKNHTTGCLQEFIEVKVIVFFWATFEV